MPSVRYVLKEPNSSEESLIFLLFNYNNRRLKFSTGEKIQPKFWNARKQRAKESAQFNVYPEFNARLNNIETVVLNTYRKLINDGIDPTPEKLRIELNVLLRSSTNGSSKDFFYFVQEFIQLSKGTKKEATIQVYTATYNILKEYSLKKKQSVDFDTITIDWYNDFVQYLSVEKKLVNNTIGKYIRTVKTFLNEATERGINKNLQYKSGKFKRLSDDVDHIYLNNEELEAIERLNLQVTPYLERTRDIFLIGCYTGLRYSDFTQIKPENIVLRQNKKYIEIKTFKTGEKVVIPLKPIVQEIIHKYDGNLPRVISNQKMNEYLKVIGEAAGIDVNVQIKRNSGNRVISETLPKWRLITTHTARRSFATNAYKMQVPALAIMKITGHRTEAAFLNYIKVSKEENAEILSDHLFFK